MQYGNTLMAAGLILSLTSINAEASLTAYSSGGQNLVYSSLGNITWTADANLFMTQANSYAGGASAYVNAVIASVPGGKIIDTPNSFDTPTWSYSGYHTLSTSDFDTTYGVVSWFGAKAFTNYLNSINYADRNEWRLPNATDTGVAGPQYGFNGTDYGYNVNTASGELARLYYDELDKKARYNTSYADPQPNFGILGTSTFSDTTGSAGPFTDVHTSEYWYGTEYVLDPGYPWIFSAADGGQYVPLISKANKAYAWAVSPGQVSAVPVPGAVWLFGSGLIGLLGFKRRRKQA
jgi:hypothetical protein